MEDKNIAAGVLGSIYWKDKEGVYQGGNDFAAMMVGLKSPDELIGKTDYDLFTKEEADAFRQNDLQVMQSSSDTVVEEEVTTPDGRKIVQLSSKRPLKDRQGNIIGIIGNTVDITFLREIQNNLIIAKQKAWLGEFAAQVAHDIKSPLQVLDNLSHDLKKRYSDDEARTYIDAIRQIHNIAADLLERYRENNTNETSTIEKAYPLWLVLLKLVDEKRIALAKHHPEIILTLEPTDDKTISAFVEITDLQRILSNLVNNATEAFKNIEKADKHIIIKLSAIDSTALIQVIDNGKGIHPERVEKFNNAQVIDSQGGHGLGLSSACQKIKTWQGNIKMVSKVGHGTTIKISLPLTLPPLWLQLNLSITSESVVFLIDDDKTTSFRLKDLLVKKGVPATQIYVYNDIESFTTDYRLYKAQGRDIFVFMDQIFKNTEQTGIDILTQEELATKSILITNDIFNETLLKRITESRVRLLPKPLFNDLTIEIKPPATNNVQYIVLDDLNSVTDYWTVKAKFANIPIATFNNSTDFMRFVQRCNKDVKIYLDNNIGEKITGLELSKQLHDMGFTAIYMITTRDDINLQQYPWITAIANKGGPFDE